VIPEKLVISKDSDKRTVTQKSIEAAEEAPEGSDETTRNPGSREMVTI
jgi:hypothetical protein